MTVLEAQPPRFAPDDAANAARRLFGIEGEAVPLGSERDQTFGIGDAVLKVSNTAEAADVVDLETRAVLHALSVDPELPLARPRELVGGGGYVGSEQGHFVRAFTLVHGQDGGPWLDDAGVFHWAAMHARLNRALQGFFHPAAGRDLLWDVARASRLRPYLAAIPEDRRPLVEDVLDRFDGYVVPRWSSLRAQVVHGDFNLDNARFDADGRVTGIFDFGDCVHTAVVADFAIGLASVLRGRSTDDVFRVGRIAIDGYASVAPFDELEQALLGDLVAARLAAIVAISAWRVEQYPENAAYIQAWDADCWRLLELHAELGPEEWAQELGAPPSIPATPDLVDRRKASMGALLTPLTYDAPVHATAAEGVWIVDAAGRRLLDAYNNVPVVGHGHPRVAEAIVRQTRRLNTHARYLYAPLVELTERLLATMPADAGLDTVMLVNSGSEANDLAWRIARGATGHAGAVVSAHAYHGVTDAMADLSPEEWPAAAAPKGVARFDPSAIALAPAVSAAASTLPDGLAATFVDAGFTSDGIYPPGVGQLAEAADATRSCGGLFVADEVQAGYGRTGRHLWAFAAHGAVPDVVTLGKPMGNGYPVAAMITRSDLLERFAYAGTVFSTFGGNPVAAQAALAVLDVIRDERVIERVGRVGRKLRFELEALDAGQVRGEGLLLGLQLDSGERAKRVVEQLRTAGVLIGLTGPRDDVLKIRPPLAFAEEHVPVLVRALREALSRTAA